MNESQIASELVRWRQDFHRFPELPMHEYHTSGRIAELLRSFGCDEVIEQAASTTSVVAVIKNGEGPVIGLSCAIDGQDEQEQNDALAYVSQNRGVMHSLGHDGEIAILLGVMQQMAKSRDFKGTLVAIFYSSYGSSLGTKALIEDGLLDQFPITELYGYQALSELPVGQIAVSAGTVMAGVGELLVHLHGQETHAGQLKASRNPILAAVSLVNSLEKFTVLESDPTTPVILSVTSIVAGDSFNHIPKEAEIKGTVRYLNSDLEEWLPMHLNDLASKIAAFYHVEAMVNYRKLCPPMQNATVPVRAVRKVARELFGDDRVTEIQPCTLFGSDFAHFLKECSGACIGLGTGGQMLRRANYDFNDDALMPAFELLIALLRDRFSQ